MLTVDEIWNYNFTGSHEVSEQAILAITLAEENERLKNKLEATKSLCQYSVEENERLKVRLNKIEGVVRNIGILVTFAEVK